MPPPHNRRFSTDVRYLLQLVVIKLHALKDRLLLIGFDSKKAEALHMAFLNGLTHGIVPPFAKVPDHVETIPDMLRLVNQ